MHGKVKLTKRQIKEDKFATFMLTAKDRLSENWQYAAIGIAIVVLAVAATIFFFQSRQTAKVEAAQKLASAQMEYRGGNTQVAILSLTQIADEYSGPTAQQAAFMLGRLNLESKNYSEAIRYFEQYAAKYPDDKVRLVAAIGGIAASYENQGQNAEAAAKYAEAIAADPEGPSAGEFRLAAMRTYLAAGNMDAARTMLDEIKAKVPNTDLANRAVRLYAEKDPTISGT